MRIVVDRWEDGLRVERTLDGLDRWEVHAADCITINIGGPHCLTATKVGVGACVWDAAIVLAAYLGEREPRHRIQGARVVEIGAGPGLVGIFLGLLGAQVILTDKEQVLPLLRQNLAENSLPEEGACELEWGAPGFMDTVKRLSAFRPSLVVAADCLYIDGDGRSPSVPDFVRTCAGLCGPSTRCFVAFEPRSDEIRASFLHLAKQRFSQVVRVRKTTYPKALRESLVELYELKSVVPNPAE
eukprot:jgi/Botrbrau1/13916/Bobra.136_2s0009.2